MPIDLTSARGIPANILARLEPHRRRIARECYLERLSDDGDIASIIGDLDEHCIREGIIGYHYTRSFETRIRASGLVAVSGADRRKLFLDEFGHLFSDRQRRTITAEWVAYFTPASNEGRDRRVWFNLTTDALRDGGADELLRFYGGEVVHKPLTWDAEIAVVLQSIGEPLVVSCALDTDSLTCGWAPGEFPWGRVWLSAYHRTVNRHGHREDLDVYASQSVPAHRIIRVQRARGWG
jgi:hypothetical protein